MRGNLLAAGVPHACKALASVHRAAKAASAAAAWRPRAARCAGGRGAASSHHLTGCRRPWDQGCDYPEPCDVSGVQKPSDRWSSAALAKAVGFRCQAAICLKAPLLQPAPGLGPKRRPYISTFCLACYQVGEGKHRAVGVNPLLGAAEQPPALTGTQWGRWGWAEQGLSPQNTEISEIQKGIKPGSVSLLDLWFPGGHTRMCTHGHTHLGTCVQCNPFSSCPKHSTMVEDQF